MTVKELKNWLTYYNDDVEVKVAIDSMIRPLTKVTIGVDMDTNEFSVWLCDDERCKVRRIDGCSTILIMALFC